MNATYARRGLIDQAVRSSCHRIAFNCVLPHDYRQLEESNTGALIVVADRKYIDTEDKPDLAALVSEVHDSHEPVVIRTAGHEVAIIRPLENREPGEPGELSESEAAAFMATSGGWEGIVDTDELLECNRASRAWSLESHDES